ncbi:hypothetical protein ZIOFF_072737 [Zingiber officinale]|uniref:dUTPase-like domain-containing protein n=1 Tax=Zingiber officinale TaxID=94328 RepID=A0A8J5ENV9_ZINOF|nr:hypothetical protein ZIOFF_072737 [Zingiber officinale]
MGRSTFLSQEEWSEDYLIPPMLALHMKSKEWSTISCKSWVRDCTLEDEEERELIAVLTKISYEESYTTPTEKHPAIDVNIDYEEDPNGIIASSEAYPYILVHRLSSTSTMLKPKSSGAAGLDLAADKTIIIEPRGRALVSTRLSLEIP